jgi:hypothetical protein
VTVQNLTVDTQTYNAGIPLRRNANNTTSRSVRVLAGSQTFGLQYAGPCTQAKPAKGKQLNLAPQRTGNIVDDAIINDLGYAGNDGLDTSCQKNATVSNINLTGDQMTVYMDSNLTVNNFAFTPGPQNNPHGFHIAGPGDHITINGYRSSGGGGIIETNDMNHPLYWVDTVTIRNYQLTGSAACGGAPCGLDIADANHVAVEPGPSGVCSFGAAGVLLINPKVSADTINVNGCSLGRTIFTSPATARITGVTYTGDTFTAPNPPGASFEDPGGAAVSISIVGGSFHNCPGTNLSNSRQLTFTVSALSGYPC